MLWLKFAIVVFPIALVGQVWILYKDAPIKGKIVSISDATGAKFSLLPPDNATGNFVKVTQRVPVKIEIENAEKYKDLLRAGMSVEVSVAY